MSCNFSLSFFGQFFLKKRENIPGFDACGKPANISENHKILEKCVFIKGDILKGIRKPILESFALDKPLGQQLIEKLEKNYEKLNISFWCFEWECVSCRRWWG